MAKLKPQERSLTITLLLFSHAFSLTHLLLLSLSHSLSLTHLFSPSLSHLFSPFHSFTELSLSLVPSLTRPLSHSFPLSFSLVLSRTYSSFPPRSLSHSFSLSHHWFFPTHWFSVTHSTGSLSHTLIVAYHPHTFSLSKRGAPSQHSYFSASHAALSGSLSRTLVVPLTHTVSQHACPSSFISSLAPGVSLTYMYILSLSHAFSLSLFLSCQ